MFCEGPSRVTRERMQNSCLGDEIKTAQGHRYNKLTAEFN